LGEEGCGKKISEAWKNPKKNEIAERGINQPRSKTYRRWVKINKGSEFTFRPKASAAVREDSAIGSLGSRSWRADLGLVAQDRMCVSRTGEDLAVRVCEQRGSELI
jgi:hypothetical protein